MEIHFLQPIKVDKGDNYELIKEEAHRIMSDILFKTSKKIEVKVYLKPLSYSIILFLIPYISKPPIVLAPTLFFIF